MLRQPMQILVQSPIALSVFLAACAVGHPVEFAGVAHPPRASAADIQSYTVLPDGYRRLGKLSVECQVASRRNGLEDAPWLEVVCDETLLRQLMRQRAAEVGGTTLVRERCVKAEPRAQGGTIECGAEVAAAPHERLKHIAESATDVGQSAEYTRGVLTARVDVTPSPGAPQRSAVDPCRVLETPQLGLDQVKIASVATRCDECTRGDAELALRSAVGSLGGLAVSAVSCRELHHGWQCLGDATVTESERAPLLVW